MSTGEVANVAGVLLAAGQSTRLADLGAKQLLDWHGKPLVRHAADQLAAVPLSQHLAVLGHKSVEVTKALDETDFELIDNPRFAAGQSTSVRAALPHIQASAALFVPCDQPFLTTEVISRIIETYTITGASIVVPRYATGRGAPVLFGRCLFDDLATIGGDQGGRQLLKRYGERVVEVLIDDARAGLDIDRPEDFLRLRLVGQH